MEGRRWNVWRKRRQHAYYTSGTPKAMAARTTKEISREAGRIFTRALPANWAVRSQEDQEDYGIDYEIELTTPADAATGFIFKVQQKGVESADYLADGSAAAYSLNVERLRYYLEDVRIPVLLVLVDVNSDAVYWRRLQGDGDVEARFKKAKEAGQASVRLHLPTANRLPASEHKLLAAVSEAFDYLTVAQIRRMPLPKMAEAISNDDDLDVLVQRLGVAKAEKARRLLEAGKFDESIKLCDEGFDDESQAVETRFQFGLLGEKALVLELSTSSDPRAKQFLFEQRLALAQRLSQIAWPRVVPAHLRHFALSLLRTARVAARADSDIGLALSLRVQQHTSDPYAIAITAGAQRKSTTALLRELQFAQFRVVRLLRGGWMHLAASAWARLVEAIVPFLRRLRTEKHEDALSAISNWFDAVGVLVRENAESGGTREEIEQWVGANLLLGAECGDFDGRVAACTDAVEKITDEHERSVAQDRLRRVASLSAEKHEPDRSVALPQMYVQMARALGINLDDPNDMIARVIRIGIDDINPERVVRQCEHIGVRLGASGIPAQMLALPTAGHKFVRCRRHGHQVYGLALDSLYSMFRREYCDSCSDLAKRPDAWKWSHEWQEAQEKDWPPEFEYPDPWDEDWTTDDDSASAPPDVASSESSNPAARTATDPSRDGDP